MFFNELILVAPVIKGEIMWCGICNEIFNFYHKYDYNYNMVRHL